MDIEAVNGRDEPVWLNYADAYHSDWRARVDGTGTSVIRTSAGFKAVQIPPGSHTVVLTFGKGGRQITSWPLAAVGAAVCLGGLIAIAAALAHSRRGFAPVR